MQPVGPVGPVQPVGWAIYLIDGLRVDPALRYQDASLRRTRIDDLVKAGGAGEGLNGSPQSLQSLQPWLSDRLFSPCPDSGH
jgi:hypothetical protein